MRKGLFHITGCMIALFLLGCQQGRIGGAQREEIYYTKKSLEDIIKEKSYRKDDEETYLKRNPFLTIDEEKFLEDYRGDIIEYLTVSAILYSSSSPHRSYAVIDGRIVKERDIVDNKEVVSISPEEVILKDPSGKEYIIIMKKIVTE